MKKIENTDNMKYKLYLKYFIIIALIAFFLWNVYRFTPHSPMEDLEYKQKILMDSKNITYTIEALRPIMGANELRNFIQENDENIDIYSPSENNITNGIYRANLHMHTDNSDGEPTVKMRMDMAQEYASNFIKDGYMVIAITDHNTILGAKKVIEVLEKNKGNYSKIKVIPGIEVFTEFHNSKTVSVPVQIHVLTWCINPYDKFLKQEFYKENLRDKWNRKLPDRNFDWVITTMSKYGITGIAHPARYTSFMKEKKYQYIKEMFARYKKLVGNTPFVEGYYQSYQSTSTGRHLGEEYEKYIEYINKTAKKLEINRTGSTDAHGYSLYKYKD